MTPSVSPVSAAGRSRIIRIDLDEIALSYNRIQVSVRMLRGLVCGTGMAALLVIVMALAFMAPGLLIVAIILVGLGLGLEYGRRRLLGGSLRAAVVLSTVFGLLLVAVLPVTLVQIADLSLQNSGAIAMYLASTALNAGLFGLLLVGLMEPIRARAQPWRLWYFDARKFSQTDELFRFIGLPVVPRGKGKRRAFGMAAGAVLMEGFGFTSYMGIGDRMWRLAERNPEMAFGVSFAWIIIGTALGLVLAKVGFAISRRLRNRARRLLIRSAEQAMANDDRRPVLFLRSFRDDQVSLANAEPDFLSFLDPGEIAGTLEELVIRSWASRGPVIAIGSPDDKSAPVGAARHYVSGEPWQQTVSRLAQQSAAIVVGVSATKGVMWEVNLVASTNQLGKTIFVVPPDLEGRPEALCKLGERLGVDLAELDGSEAGGGTRLVAFFSDGEDQYVAFTSKRPTEHDYELALRRFQQNCASADVASPVSAR